MRKELTAVILTKNEEGRVERCISSLSQVAKLVVIDSFSEDKTFQSVQKAWLEMGRSPSDLLFISRAWAGFTDARNYSLRWVTTTWVLWIDADEWIEEDFQLEISRMDFSTLPNDVYEIARRSKYLNRWVRFGGWYPDYKKRIGRSDSVVWKKGPRGADVHEDLHSTGEEKQKIYAISGHLGHEPFRNRREHRETNWRYSSLLAEGLFLQYQTGERRPYTILEIWIKVVIKFIENFVIKLGFFDGWIGWIIARGSSQSLYWRLTKAKKLYKESLHQ